ncbi:hypothetical protein [Saccharopolyspora mangrovi]|uniref:DUF2746 domain-containing protein n=1 Tax=Saccharopolyspora mangrovi TaxID=3082379 RepID=A0ABU6A7K0_9PSEU|nr:hypothetical protein [Saccharopolyspora sp. S2-29]MEB3367364.1 hypothetical protein [Saccharopolyspora sp. S2-29]
MFTDQWDGPLLVLIVVLWIWVLNENIHHHVATEIQLRIDRLQDEMAETNTELADQIQKRFDEIDILRSVVKRIGSQASANERRLIEIQEERDDVTE